MLGNCWDLQHKWFRDLWVSAIQKDFNTFICSFYPADVSVETLFRHLRRVTKIKPQTIRFFQYSFKFSHPNIHSRVQIVIASWCLLYQSYSLLERLAHKSMWSSHAFRDLTQIGFNLANCFLQLDWMLFNLFWQFSCFKRLWLKLLIIIWSPNLFDNWSLSVVLNCY